jgi:hypothetical protein
MHWGKNEEKANWSTDQCSSYSSGFPPFHHQTQLAASNLSSPSPFFKFLSFLKEPGFQVAFPSSFQRERVAGSSDVLDGSFEHRN